MDERRGSREYFEGVAKFVEFASIHARWEDLMSLCEMCEFDFTTAKCGM